MILSETESGHLHRTSTAAGLAIPKYLKIIHLTRLPSEKNDLPMIDVVDKHRAVWPSGLGLPDEVGYLSFVNIYPWDEDPSCYRKVFLRHDLTRLILYDSRA